MFGWGRKERKIKGEGGRKKKEWRKKEEERGWRKKGEKREGES